MVVSSWLKLLLELLALWQPGPLYAIMSYEHTVSALHSIRLIEIGTELFQVSLQVQTEACALQSSNLRSLR